MVINQLKKNERLYKFISFNGFRNSFLENLTRSEKIEKFSVFLS